MPEVHPDQEEIPPDGPWVKGSAGTCYWCSEQATYANLDIGLPKKPHQPRTYVSACAYHYANVVAPNLERVRLEKVQRGR